MGKWRAAYESLYQDYLTTKRNVSHWQSEAAKSVGYAKRERERGDNLQRQAQALEGEVARLKVELEREVEGAKRAYESMCDWHARYDAAMKRIDELEAQVKAPTPTEVITTGVPTQSVQGVNVVRSQIVAVPVSRTRRKMPDERTGGHTVSLRVGDRRLVKRCPSCEQPLPNSPRCTSFTLTVNPFEPGGGMGEFFLKPSHDEKTDLIASLADLWATASSYAIQFGGDPKWLLDRAHYCHDLSGGKPLVWNDETGEYDPHPLFSNVNSMMDYAARIIERIREGKPAVKLTPEEEAERAKKLAEAEALT